MRFVSAGLAFAFFLLFTFPSLAQSVTEENTIYKNWLSVVSRANKASQDQDIPVYNIIASDFLQLYQETGEPAYLNFAINEANSVLRSSIVSGLTGTEKEQHFHLLERIENYELTPEDFRRREFSPFDIYLFIRPDIHPEHIGQARGLLDYWRDGIPAAFRQSEAKGALLTQAVIRGYDLLDEFYEVNKAGSYLIGQTWFPPSEFALSLYEIISYSSRTLGFYNQALDINQEHLQPISEMIGDKNLQLTIKLDYASTLFRIGRVNSALREYENIYNHIEFLTDDRYKSALFNNLAISYLNTGRFDQYVEFQLEAYEIAGIANNYSQQLSILRNLFIFYRRQNNTELAYNYLHQALELSEEQHLDSETSSILLSLGIYVLDVEHAPLRALEHFEQAKTVAENSNNFHHFYNSLIELGEAHFEIGNAGQAEEYFTRAIRLSENRNDETGYIQAVVRLANLFTKINRFEQAESLIQPFTLRDFRQMQFNLQILATNTLLKVYLHNKEYGRAARLSSAMIAEISDWLRESMDHQTGHMWMDEEFSEAYRLHSQLLFETGKYNDALAAVMELRDISRSGFYNNPMLKSRMLTEDELIRDYNLSSNIRSLRQQYKNASESQRVHIGNDLLTFISERNALQNRVLPGAKKNDTASEIASAQKSLKRDDVVIMMSVLNDQIFRYVITNTQIHMKTFGNSANAAERLDQAISSLGRGKTDLIKLYDVYEFFLKDILDEQEYSHIYFVPDNNFYRLPIEILPVTKPNHSTAYGSATYLLENKSVSYLNTISELNQVHEHVGGEFRVDISGFGINDFASAGHPRLQNLPYSPVEAETSLLQLTQAGRKQLFLNEQSTKSNFRAAAGQSKILHLATHSQVNADDPLFSTIYFYQDQDNEHPPDSENNGIIQTYELFDMNLNAELVFLSSCESGSGGYLEGAGILGFSRAFFYAGAKSLSLNLWLVQDQTAAQITAAFYESLNQGLNKAAALRQARLHYLNHTNSDPYVWGSMVLFGNIDSPFHPAPDPVLVQLLSGILLAVGTFFFAFAGYHKFRL